MAGMIFRNLPPGEEVTIEGRQPVLAQKAGRKIKTVYIAEAQRDNPEK